MAQLVAANSAADFPLLGFAHLAILGGVAILGTLLAVVQRTLLRGSKVLRIAVGIVLLADTLAWYGYQLFLRQPLFPDHLPMELCDITLVLVLVVLLAGHAAVFDIVYYFALAGTSMALLTPNLWEQFPSLATGQFFFAHGVVVASVLYLVLSRQFHPRPGSVGRALVALNVWAVIAGSFDSIYKTNYMYLRHKPQSGSLLNVLGPWPWYIGGGEVLAVILFLLLYFPFRPSGAPGT